MPEALFDVAAAEPAPAAPKLSRDARRTQRQAEAINHGQHPLAVALRIPLRLHTDAPTNPHERDTPGLRCGTCRHRDPHNGGTASAFPKCWLPGPNGIGYPRITSGPGTDCRAWWPACLAYQPKDAS